MRITKGTPISATSAAMAPTIGQKSSTRLNFIDRRALETFTRSFWTLAMSEAQLPSPQHRRLLMSSTPTQALPPSIAQRLPRWKFPILLPVILLAERDIATSPVEPVANSQRSSPRYGKRAAVSRKEKRAAWIHLFCWSVVLLVAVLGIGGTVFAVAPSLALTMPVLAWPISLVVAVMLALMLIFPIATLPAALSFGWKAWVDSTCRSIIFTDRQGRVRAFWSVNSSGSLLARDVIRTMMVKHKRSGYQPRSERHSRAYQAAVQRLGYKAAPRNEKNTLGWWEVH